MQTQMKSSRGITLVPAETRLLSSRRLFLEGEITQETACEFAKLLMVLLQEDPAKPISVFINSPGGDTNAGLLVFDLIRSSPAPVQTVCLGQAYSMAAILLAAGSRRLLLPHSEVMLHEPLLQNRVSGSASTIRSISESLLETQQKLNGLLAQLTGHTEAEIEAATTFDHYFSADQAIAFGLADEIVTLAILMEELK